MSKPTIDSFFIGRALAEGLYEQFENVFTQTLSELGKCDAQQREKLRQFAQQVVEKASQEAQATGNMSNSTTTMGNSSSTKPVDLQETIDELRAEVAQVRSELQSYRNPSE